MLRCESDRGGVTWQRIVQHDITQLAHRSPAHNEQDLDAQKKTEVKNSLAWLYGFIAVLEQQGTGGVDDEATSSEDAKGPSWVKRRNCRIGGKGVDYPAEPDARGRDADGEAATVREPLWDDANRADVKES